MNDSMIICEIKIDKIEKPITTRDANPWPGDEYVIVLKPLPCFGWLG